MHGFSIRGRIVRAPEFQRRHYEALAAILRDLDASGALAAEDAKHVRELFTDHLHNMSDYSFQPERFREAATYRD